MSLRDDIYMSTTQLLENLDKCDDAGLQRVRNEIGEYLRLSKYLAQCIENNMKEDIVSLYTSGNVLVHKMTGSKHVVNEREFLDEFNNYDFVCEQPHGDGDYNYKCYDRDCKCQS